MKLQHASIGETVESQVQANKLDAELNTFSTLLSRECQDKLEIDTLFASERLDRFVPILNKNGFKECRELVVKDDAEFEKDILSVLDDDIQKQIKEWKRRNPNAQDPYEQFLDHYKLTKYKRGLRKADLESLEDFGDEGLDDETMEEIITEAKITGLGKKRFKRAVKEAQNDEYKAEEQKEVVIQGDEDVKPLDISSREELALKRICTQYVDSIFILAQYIVIHK